MTLFETHSNDRTMLLGCYKRALSFGNLVSIPDQRHPLYVMWSNCELMLSDFKKYVPQRPKKLNKKYWHECRLVKYRVIDIGTLQWFAYKLDIYAKNNILRGDPTVAYVLGLFKNAMFFDPRKL